MSLLTWTDELSVSVAKIDDQHKKMVEMVNELHSAMLVRRGREVLGRIIEGMADYSATHFQTEEDYMRRYGYPKADYDLQKNEHDKFTAQIMDLKEKFEMGNLGVTVELMNFLCDWLIDHIMKTDKKMGPFFASKGVK